MLDATIGRTPSRVSKLPPPSVPTSPPYGFYVPMVINRRRIQSRDCRCWCCYQKACISSPQRQMALSLPLRWIPSPTLSELSPSLLSKPKHERSTVRHRFPARTERNTKYERSTIEPSVGRGSFSKRCYDLYCTLSNRIPSMRLRRLDFGRRFLLSFLARSSVNICSARWVATRSDLYCTPSTRSPSIRLRPFSGPLGYLRSPCIFSF